MSVWKHNLATFQHKKGAASKTSDFAENIFEGEMKLFPEGKYQSVSSVGNLFRAASSVRKTTC